MAQQDVFAIALWTAAKVFGYEEQCFELLCTMVVPVPGHVIGHDGPTGLSSMGQEMASLAERILEAKAQQESEGDAVFKGSWDMALERNEEAFGLAQEGIEWWQSNEDGEEPFQKVTSENRWYAKQHKPGGDTRANTTAGGEFQRELSRTGTSSIPEPVDVMKLRLLQKDCMLKACLICEAQNRQRRKTDAKEMRHEQSRSFLRGGYIAPLLRQTSVPKTVYFLLDTGPSMTDFKLDRARNIMNQLFLEHLQDSDDVGVGSFDSELRRVQHMMPRHVFEPETWLEGAVPDMKLRCKRRLFDALKKAYHDLAFRKARKGDKKEQYIVLFTDYKGKTVDLDHDGTISEEELQKATSGVLAAIDSNHDGIISEEERMEHFDIVEDSQSGNEQMLKEEVEHTAKSHLKVNLVVVYITGQGLSAEQQDREQRLLHDSDNLLFEMAEDYDNVKFIEHHEDAVDQMQIFWAETVDNTREFMRNISMETFM